MAKSYDNIEDAKAKLAASIVYYDGVPVYIKNVDEQGDGSFHAILTNTLTGKHLMQKDITDPLFNFTRFNLGYSNHKASACWWYRVPAKQYKQGLKSDQLRHKASDPAMATGGGFAFNPTTCINEMLINQYPSMEEAEKAVRDADWTRVVAFHKNFAMSYDKIHKDMLLEYKGTVIGFINKNLGLQLVEEYEHLYESLKEVVNVR